MRYSYHTIEARLSDLKWVAALLAVTFGCAPPREIKSRQDNHVAEASAMRNHCDAIKSVLGDVFEKYDLECLGLPGIVISGVYGPSQYPNENTIEMGFGGTVPPGIIGPVRPGGTLGRAFETSRHLSGQGGLELQEFYSWLPSMKISASSDDTVSVSVRLGDVEIRPIHGVKRAIEDTLSTEKNVQRRRSIQGMRADLCKKDYVISTFAIAAKPMISIRSTKKQRVDSSVGWKVAGFSADMNAVDRGEVTLAATQTIVFAVQTRPSAPMLEDLCKACEYDVTWHGYAHPHLEKFACPLASGAKVRAKFDGYPVVTSTEDNKIWNGWIVMSIHEPGATCSKGASCRGTHGEPFPAPPNWTHFTITREGIVPQNGLSEWELSLDHCQTGPKAAQCGTMEGARVRIEQIP